ncbi:MAG: potassium channel family protein, partial [Planctomycetes bacterium]|nr:potassium channel family protein [Planctomycetota bacterium]
MRLPLNWRLWCVVMLPLILLFVGAIGYRMVGGDEWTWSDAIFMSAITLTTVGYGETRPLTAEGRWFTIVFLFVGVFTLFFTATEIIRAM